jgi:signal transduction histidine kinase
VRGGDEHGMVARLRGVELFAELSPDQLAWLAGIGTRLVIDDGDVLFEDGQVAEHFYVLLDGELLISKCFEEQEKLLDRHLASAPAEPATSPGVGGKPRAAHQFTGELPLLVGGGYVAKAVAAGRTELLVYGKDVFLEMFARCPDICRVLLPVLAWRIRSYEAQAGRRLMLAGLNTLAAGLAHELNNPVAALVRAADEFGRTMRELAAVAIEWGAVSRPGERGVLEPMVVDLLSAAPAGGALAMAEMLDLVQDWLVARQVPRAGELAPLLTDHGITPAGLDLLADSVRVDVLGVALSWLAFRLHAESLVIDVTQTGRSISALVDSVAAYSDLDRAPRREVDVLAGIEATLGVLAPALSGIDVLCDFAELPKITAHLGELNQVWTQLIHNAADAMRVNLPKRAELRIVARAEGAFIVVEVCDNGPGVPLSLMSQLFQPFFTTKDIGKGTGLGLYLSHEIIARQHSGSIGVTSVPGDTRFVVRLPVGQEA